MGCRAKARSGIDDFVACLAYLPRKKDLATLWTKLREEHEPFIDIA